MPGFELFSVFLHHFVQAKLATSSMRVNSFMPVAATKFLLQNLVKNRISGYNTFYFLPPVWKIWGSTAKFSGICPWALGKVKPLLLGQVIDLPSTCETFTGCPVGKNQVRKFCLRLMRFSTRQLEISEWLCRPLREIQQAVIRPFCLTWASPQWW